MRRTYLFVMAGVLTASLATWAAIRGAQPEHNPESPGWRSGRQAGDPPPVIPPPPLPEPTGLPTRLPESPKDPPSLPAPPPPPSGEVLPSVPVPPPVPAALEKMDTPPVMPSVPAPPSPPPAPAPEPVGKSITPPDPPAMPSAPSSTMPARLPSADVGPPTGAPTTVAARQPFDEAPVTSDNSAGRQEPAVSLEWVGAPVAKVGQPADYFVLVRNVCNVPVQQVTVRVRVPAGLRVCASEPRAMSDGGVMVWDLGTLMARQEKSVQLKMQADVKGDMMPQAWVTFTGSSVMRVRVREPKLAIKASVSDKALVGDPAAFTLTVSNPGDGSADQVKVHAKLSEGLEHARGNKIDFDVGNLAPGESRNVTLLCATRAGGPQKCEVTARAEGGLEAADAAAVNVITPRLDLVVEGPGLRYLDRKALYVLKVTNPGDAPAMNVTVADAVPAGFKVLAASDGGRHDYQARVVSWFLGEIGPQQTRTVQLEVQAVNAGEHKHKATAVGARGLRAEAEKTTRVEGLAALMVEMVDTEDPIEVSGSTSYEVTITNTGSKTENDIKLAASIPDKMQFAGAQGPVHYQEEGKTVVFAPIAALAPRATAIFRINVKTLEQGTVRFKIQVTSANLTDPVVKMEATRIYSDAPESQASPGTIPAAPASIPPSMPATPAPPPSLPPSVPPPPRQ